MSEHSRHDLIKRLQREMPRRAPFDVASLKKLGISAQQAAHYAESDWLIRLGHGVYAFPGDSLDAHATIRFLQQRVEGLHVAGKSALALQGVRHNVLFREQLVLWGAERFVIPDWVNSRFSARYVSATLFDWPDDALNPKSLTTPPGILDGMLVSVPERAVLELLYEVGTRQGLEEARNLFQSLRNLRREMVVRLLACCTSVKTVRLFLTWAREDKLLDVDALLEQYSLPVGSASRWMTRLKDGTLLTLKPHG